MKTAEERQLEAIKQLIDKYGAALSPESIVDVLRGFEIVTHKYAEMYCNGEIESKDWEAVTDTMLAGITSLFDTPIPGLFINGDPRGYALKINDTETKALRAEGIYLHQDWGGYGILAPEAEEG